MAVSHDRAWLCSLLPCPVVYLKSAELGMTYLDCTEWENAKYRKRDFFVQYGSDNVKICSI
ncbi:hypothetical protein GOBAR_AA16253 [Gossypium barbadense]|uniref:Uncharacterized protein n=1 Tax=Gossypium barbadense TaxID=3634 RepID=A0A2P5XM77_GOSBA|nr:hypothetical protein GOBAR_AA16253 [Gossypium barbadense]